MKPVNLSLSRFAKFVLLSTFCLVFLGGMVTSMNAGLSVPDWPTTYGYNMFTFPISKWVGLIAWEHVHRLMASLIGMLTIVLAAWTWRVEERGWVRALAIGALLLVIVQGVMGGLRVTELSVTLAIVHGCVAQAFLCVLALLALALSPAWDVPLATGVGSDSIDSCRRWAWTLTGAIYIQLILGAVMRHLHAGLAIPTFPLTPEGTLMPQVHNMMVDLHFTHRFWAVLVTAAMIFLVTKILVSAASEPRLVKPALWLAALVVLQIVLGAFIIWTYRAPIPTSLHVLNGATVLVVSFILAVRASRFSAPDSPSYPVSAAQLLT